MELLAVKRCVLFDNTTVYCCVRPNWAGLQHLAREVAVVEVIKNLVAAQCPNQAVRSGGKRGKVTPLPEALLPGHLVSLNRSIVISSPHHSGYTYNAVDNQTAHQNWDLISIRKLVFRYQSTIYYIISVISLI